MTIDHTAAEATDTVYDAVVAALTETLGRPLEEATVDTSLFHEIGLDSTGVLDVLMILEESVGVELDMESLEMEDFATIGTLADFLRRAKAS